MHFRLVPYCTLVEGAARGALYNFQSGKVHSINRSAVNIIKACYQQSIEEEKQKNWLPFLEKLCQLGLGSFYFTPPISDTEYSPSNQPATPVKLDFLWLELTSVCNNRCLHCYTGSTPANVQGKVTHEQWLSIIQQAANTGASSIQLIGGEPLLYPQWKDLVIEAHAQGFQDIELFTNATMIDAACIEFFKQYHVNIATTIYANHAAVHDLVTQNPGSFAATMQAIRMLLAAKIPLRIASIIMKANQDEVEGIIKLLKELGIEPTPPDIVRPTGRGDDKELLPTTYFKDPIQPPFFTDQQTFERLHKFHSCLAGKLAITADGDVLPCIFAREQVCGNILTNTLTEILAGQSLQKVWTTTKDSITKCKDCEYRYACYDCRPQAQGSDPNKDWLASPIGCDYDPYTGSWQQQPES